MPLESPTDPTALRQAFSCFPSGVTALCAVVDGELVGMAVSSFSAVSLNPPLISVCIQDTSQTWHRLRDANRIGVSVFTEEQGAHCRQLSLKTGDRFTGIDWHISGDGAMFVPDAAAMFACSLDQEMEAGDHSIALLEIHSMAYDATVAPLVFHGSTFRQLA